jgi:hypothetical protein
MPEPAPVSWPATQARIELDPHATMGVPVPAPRLHCREHVLTRARGATFWGAGANTQVMARATSCARARGASRHRVCWYWDALTIVERRQFQTF